MMIRFILPVLVAVQMLTTASAQCDTEQTAYATCITTNIVSCGVGCLSFPDGANDDIFEPVCAGLTSTCAALTCCDECNADGKALVACQFASAGCDKTCDDVQVPSPPAIAPTTQQCSELSNDYALCLATNFLSCGVSCVGFGDGLGDDVVCDDVIELCQGLSCCPECLDIGKNLINCGFEQCDRNCDNVSPVAPTPVDACDTEELTTTTCFLQNLLECGNACDGVLGGEDDDGFQDCSDIDRVCQELTCCPPCISVVKDWINCNAANEGCAETCDLAPAAPSPVVPTPFFPTDPCDSEELDATLCFAQNLVECGLACQDLADLEECSDADTVCQSLSCCPPCLPQTKALLNCNLQDKDCAETCDLAPAAPSPVVPTPFFPTDPCDSAQVDYALCFLQNIGECFECGDGVGDFDGPCDMAGEACRALECCPPCIALGKESLNCQLAENTCSTNCDGIAPAAPSPVAPISLFPTPACSEEETALAVCLGQNALDCAIDCLSGDEIVFGCETVDASCAAGACCPACLMEAKAALNCNFELQGCDRNCDDIAPAAPTPTAPTPLFPDLCIAEQTDFSFCIARNALECAFACAQVGDVDFDCDNVEAACNSLDCCPPCLDLSKALLNCELNSEGCDSDCGGATTLPPATTPPDTAPPDTTPVPETGVPETPVPETPVPETSVPDTPAPGTPAPVGGETPAPDTPVPGTEAPATTVPMPTNAPAPTDAPAPPPTDAPAPPPTDAPGPTDAPAPTDAAPTDAPAPTLPPSGATTIKTMSMVVVVAGMMHLMA